LGLGVQTTAVHTDARMQKEEKDRLRLTQEHDGASELVGHARHSHVPVVAIEPPRVPRSIPVVALAGETRGGSVFWAGAVPGTSNLDVTWHLANFSK
jgi:hypothetical protein